MSAIRHTRRPHPGRSSESQRPDSLWLHRAATAMSGRSYAIAPYDSMKIRKTSASFTSSRPASIFGLAASVCLALSAPAISRSCRAYVCVTGVGNIDSASTTPACWAMNPVSITDASTAIATRPLVSAAASATRPMAQRKSRYSKATTANTAAATQTMIQSGTACAIIAATSGIYRMSQYRLMSRPYRAGAVTSA